MTQLIASKHFFDIVTQVARKAGEYQKSKINVAHNIEYKGAINIVTEVDKVCEAMIVEEIRHHFPNHDIMAEEGSGERKDSPYKWIIDPLDGTTNFAHSYPLFSVSIALEYQGKVLAGVVYDPMRDEIFCGFSGEGATLNGKKIMVSGVNQLERALMGTGFAYNLRQTKDNNFDHFQNIITRVQGVRRDGVASLDVCYVACGRYDGYWELNLFPWDTAAGIVIALEAGATITRFDGGPYTVYEKDILVTNTKIHDEVKGVLVEGIQRRTL